MTTIYKYHDDKNNEHVDDDDEMEKEEIIENINELLFNTCLSYCWAFVLLHLYNPWQPTKVLP